MKITQEVRDFAAKQNASADSFLAATPLPEAEAEAGMAAMSKVFKETGGELYVGGCCRAGRRLKAVRMSRFEICTLPAPSCNNVPVSVRSGGAPFR